VKYRLLWAQHAVSGIPEIAESSLRRGPAHLIDR
jgi:hypothetical protein